MAQISVLYDGWPLSYRFNSPPALHLQTILACLPGEVQAVVAAPVSLPDALPPGVEVRLVPAPDTEVARLRWEQNVLPGLARKWGVDLVHLASGSPALFGASRSVLSPAGPDPVQPPEARRSLAGRLREALGEGGLWRAQAVLWPADLPDPGMPVAVLRQPPAVHPLFRPEQGLWRNRDPELDRLEVPDTYVLYHGSHTETDLGRLLEAWSWATGPLGADLPLLLPGMDGLAVQRLALLQQEYPAAGSARGLPVLAHSTLAALYRGCSALFHPAEITPWGNAVRKALACGRPVVALETERIDALVGPAGYLISGDPEQAVTQRALGAALITVMVEESLAERLSEAALQRAAAWDPERFGQELLKTYNRLKGAL